MQDSFSEGPSAVLARFASELCLDAVPAEVVAHTRNLVLDALGCCIQGSGLQWTRLVRDMVLGEAGPPQSTIIGSPHRVAASQAVLVNATAGHAFEMDDIHRDSIIHGGSIVTPIAIALAQARGGMTGRHMLESVIAGYEVGTRVGAAASQSLLLKGFHPQGTTGTIAAGAAASRALNLDPRKTQHTIGAAASQSAGLMAAQEGAMVKRFHSGRAAQSGVYAALMCERGFTGIENVVEADYGGFLHAYSDDPRPDRLLNGLGERWETADVGYKPFAAVTSIHTALEALSTIVVGNGFTPADIAHIHAYVSEPTYQHCAWEYRAQSVTAAQMNIFYGLAVMVLDGAAFVDQFAEARIDDPIILDFIKRIDVTSDPAINALGPESRHTARLVVTATSGEKHELTVSTRKGSPDNPLSQREIENKFRSNACSLLSETQADELYSLVQRLDTLDDVETLVPLLTAG